MKPGDVVADRFVLEWRAGAGGMGEVFRALDRVTGEAVAIKVMLGEQASDVARFAREVKALSDLRSPGIVRYVAHGVCPAGEPFLAMEWLSGEDLSERLRRGPLSVSETVKLGAQVAEALALAHARGVVHRDLKPSNLFLVDGDLGRVKVLDFGVAWQASLTRMTGTGALIGTPGYMAPEQARGAGEIDASADVFALGCVLFECLTCRPAFSGSHVIALLTRVLFDEAPHLRDVMIGAPEDLDALVTQMLAKDPAARPRDGAAALAALAALSAPPEVCRFDDPRTTEDRSDFRTLPPTVVRSAPGLVLVFAGGRAERTVVALDGGQVELGRQHPIFKERPDARVSRRHARVSFQGGRFFVTDLGSHNGTDVDGVPVVPNEPIHVIRVIRVGDSLFAPMRDVEPLQRLGVRVEGGRVEGPALQEVVRAAVIAARLGPTLHITGEGGVGREALARAFHAAGPAPGGPFVAVDCATLPEGAADRLLFGEKRGVHAGVDADAEGYIAAAHGGTLFLEEVAELGSALQAKLLGVLETGEVLALGAARPRKVDLRFCSATRRDLRALLAAGELREDLYLHIASPRVVAPPLRERPEEIAWLLQGEVERIAPGLLLHASLVETCLLRAWPGNVRELCAEARVAAQSAVAEGAARVEARHLRETAGLAFAALIPAPEGGAPRTGDEDE